MWQNLQCSKDLFTFTEESSMKNFIFCAVIIIIQFSIKYANFLLLLLFDKLLYCIGIYHKICKLQTRNQRYCAKFQYRRKIARAEILNSQLGISLNTLVINMNNFRKVITFCQVISISIKFEFLICQTK